mgnify:CR=1
MQQATAIDWNVVDQVAVTLGVSYRARQKWRQRGTIPYKWRLPILQLTGGVISAEHFAALDRRRERVQRTQA